MTGSNVMNLMQANQIDFGNLVKSLGKLTKSSGSSDSFQNVMFSSSINTANITMQTVNGTTNKNANLETDSSMSTEYEKFQYKENNIKKGDVKSFEENANDVADDIKEFKEELMQTIADDLGVDEEQIENVLAQLGMVLMDLLEPQKLVAFVQEISGIEFSADLLMNEDFQMLLTDINSAVTELMKDTGYTIEELQEFSAYLDENPTFVTVMEEAVTQVEADTVNGRVEEIASEAEEVLPEERVEVKENRVENEEVVQFEEKAETIAEFETDMNQNFSKNEMKEKDSTPVIVSGEQPVVETQNVFDTFVENVSSYSGVDAQKIMDQIVEQVKISVQTNETSIEMQLNPENLGKVYMNISSKEGAVSAQLYASNENVKEALEMQMITLKENLEQSGVKVDAIEVSVGTHEFERNLEQDQKREEENGEYQEEVASKRRNLNIDFLDELSGMMSEEEALVAQIMRDNGNSVDLTA